MPRSADKFAVAARAEALGAAVVVESEDVTDASLAAAIARVLGEAAYARHASVCRSA